MTPITLTLRSALPEPVDAGDIDITRFAQLDEPAIAALPLRIGTTTTPLGDLFSVQGGMSPEVRIDGDVSSIEGLGAGMSAGHLIVNGNAGDRVGAGMTGGRIHVLGRVGHDAGVGMRGGELLVDSDAGDRLGGAEAGARRGMRGGEILVSGSAGSEVGARARRGLIAIGGRAGADLARDIIAGTVVVFGRIGANPGTGSKRGSIVSVGGIDIPAGYRLACTYQPPFVRLLMTYLARRFGADISDAILSGRYRRYCGDATTPGKGEILEWIRG